MNTDLFASIPLWAIFVGTIVLVAVATEAG